MFLVKSSPALLKNAVNAYSMVCNLHTSTVFRGKRRKSSCESSCSPKPVAVILCGAGGLDGTEIAEAVSIAVHCYQNNLVPKFYAPDIDIVGLVDHSTKEPENCGSSRNALVEAARIARPTIKPLCECMSCSLEALIIPGGYGAIRTLSDFESKGADCTVLPELQSVIEDFSCDKKPIGTLCIGASLVAKVLRGVKVTLGKESPKEDWPYATAIRRVKDMGAKIEFKEVTGVTYCKRYNVFSNPAWLYAPATYGDVHEGIGKMISRIAKAINRR